MFNFLVAGKGWHESNDAMPVGRTFEYTKASIAAEFRDGDFLDVAAVRSLPTILTPEAGPFVEQIAYVVQLINVERQGANYELEYIRVPDIPAIPVTVLQSLTAKLGIEKFEFERTHWAIKEADLFRALLSHPSLQGPRPTVFNTAGKIVDDDLVCVMMPFAASFNDVYDDLRIALAAAGKTLTRADDIWNHPNVMQDVVDLICTSRVVICDLTDRNPNVFYETGIAHAQAKDVILITQSMNDVPFDLRHLRVVVYENNKLGRQKMTEAVMAKLKSLMGF